MTLPRKKNWLARLFSFDHRKSERKSAPGLVAYYWDGAAPQAHEIQNISSTGFYLRTKERWHLGTVVTMTLQKTGVAGSSSELYIAVQSKVVRLGDDGVGFVFIQLEPHGADRGENLKSVPAGKKALEKFLDQILHRIEDQINDQIKDQIKSDLGHVTSGALAEGPPPKRARAPATSGNVWRRRYETIWR